MSIPTPGPRRKRFRTVIGGVIACLVVASCRSSPRSVTPSSTSVAPSATLGPKKVTAVVTTTSSPPSAIVNVYAATMANGRTNPKTAGIDPVVLVPNSDEGTVSVIDPRTYRVVRTFRVGRNPQHIGPSWDLTTLFVSNDLGNSLTPIDARTGSVGPAIPVTDPYNLYYTPDGRSAIVVAERLRRLDFRDPHTWALQYSIAIPHRGANHLDFSADEKTLLISCEFSGWIDKIDLKSHKIVGELNVGGQPIDVKVAPDGSVFFVANMTRGGVSVIDPNTMTEKSFIATGMGAHGLYPSRDTTKLYVANRRSNSVSVVDFSTRRVVATWRFKGTPDMGGVSADGTELWLSGRYSREVYVIDTSLGVVTHRIAVGRGPHGLTFFPQPGRYSLGHTGNYR
jgi:YVTN family beta-propeller protein